MKTAHTPSPWAIDPKSIGIANGPPHRYTVYELRGGPDICDSVAASREVEANARLMAAAPSLLAALEWARDALYDYGDSSVIRDVEAAIAAARGEKVRG